MIAAAIARLRAAGKGIARPDIMSDDFNLYEIIVKLPHDEVSHFAAAADHIDALGLIRHPPKANQSMQIINHGRCSEWIAKRRQEASHA
jgi:hypothetical protein